MTEKQKRPPPLFCMLIAMLDFACSIFLSSGISEQIVFSTLTITMLIVAGVVDILNKIDDKFS